MTVSHPGPRAKEWRVCALHPDVDPDRMWGCPDCLHELRTQLARVTAEKEELRVSVSNFDRLYLAARAERDELTERLTLMKERHNSRAEAAEAALSAHREALEKLVTEWRQRQQEWAALIGKRNDDFSAEYSDGRAVTFEVCADELADRLAALASPRQEVRAEP